MEINTVSKTTFACCPDVADNEMKMTFWPLGSGETKEEEWGGGNKGKCMK